MNQPKYKLSTYVLVPVVFEHKKSGENRTIYEKGYVVGVYYDPKSGTSGGPYYYYYVHVPFIGTLTVEEAKINTCEEVSKW